MTLSLAKNWWSLLIRGLIALALGLVSLTWPAITLAALVLLFGAYSLLDGVVSLVGAVRAVRAHERWGALVFEGIAGIAAAAVTVLWPAITGFALVYIIAAWALVTGGMEIAAAIRLRQHISGEWLLGLGGVASIIFGIIALFVPLVGALAIALMVGVYLLIFGVILISLSIRMRSWAKTLHPGAPMPLPAH